MTPENRALARLTHEPATDSDGTIYCVNCEVSEWPCAIISCADLSDAVDAANARAEATEVRLAALREENATLRRKNEWLRKALNDVLSLVDDGDNPCDDPACEECREGREIMAHARTLAEGGDG